MTESYLELARNIVQADELKRQTLLHTHPVNAGVPLAYALKEIGYDQWNSEPAQTANAALALVELASRTGEPEIEALASWMQGIAALADGRMERAIEYLDHAAEQFAAIGLLHTSASTQLSKLMALALLGRYEEATRCGLQARDQFLAEHDLLAAGKVEQNLGNIAFRRDQYREAEQLYRVALERFMTLGDQVAITAAKNGLANALVYQGNVREAAPLFVQALAIATQASLEVRQAEIENNLGNVALIQGRYRDALEYLERSRRRYATLEMPHESAYTEQELAEAYLEINLVAEAAAIYERVIPTFAALDMQREHAWALAHGGRAQMKLGNGALARHLLHQAQALFAAEGNAVCEALVLLFQGELAYAEQDYAVAGRSAAQAEMMFRQANAVSRALFARWLCGESLRRLAPTNVVQTLLESTLHEAETHGLPQISQRCATSLGLLALALGDQQRAQAAFVQSIAYIERLRAPLPAEEFRTAFFANKLVPYSEMVRICLAAEPPQIVEALSYSERARSRALIEMLGGAVQVLPRPRNAFEAELLERLSLAREELNWVYGQLHSLTIAPEAVKRLSALARERETVVLELTRQLQQADSNSMGRNTLFDLAGFATELDEQTALVAYMSLEDELLAFVLIDGQCMVFRELAELHQVEESVAQLRFQTETLRYGSQNLQAYLPQLARRTLSHLHRLYNWLVRPFAQLVGSRRLVIVPHGVLHYVPFHTLYDGQHYLIQQQEVCYAPSIAVLQHCLNRPQADYQRAVLFGIPDAAAPRVHDEIVTLATLLPHATIMLDDQATLAALQAHAPTADLLHLACHGRFRPDNPLFSALRLADGWLTVQDAYGLELNCDLVILSACETGISTIAPGDELVGLARSFFAAGTASLLLSLWTVDDGSTAELMSVFYQKLFEGQRPAAALRAAQCALIERYPHPFYWSPFVLLGRW
jgi:CHAT domain-containing protein/tetratricopeptide (TPR) repeat protein